MAREFDIILWGATGFTGQLVAEYLAQQYGTGGELRWAIAGRNRDKLSAVRERCATGAGESLPILVCDSADRAGLDALVQRTSVVCSTVGPYARHGTPLVAACAAAGTDYCDLTGEVQWVARMIREQEAPARDSGARIVHCCGFDSVPFDMGVWFLQQEMQARHGSPAQQVKGRMGRFSGGASGGTVASILNLLEEAGKDRQVRAEVANPYLLYPPGTPAGGDGPDQRGAVYDEDFRSWTAPFIMAAINTRVVRRSNALLGFPWGEDFRYDEAQLSPSRGKALVASLGTGFGMLLLAFGPTRRLIQRRLPAPGEGPSAEQRAAGFYQALFYGIDPQHRERDLKVSVSGDLDPGYGSTSRMLAEAALCLARDDLGVGGGIWTPASALGAPYLQRLRERAGLTFEVV